MPKVRRAQSPSIDSSQAYPYPSNSKNVESHNPMNFSGSVNEIKEWEDARCSICMEHPHNAVILKCSSHERGCRPYMCNTSYRHSNCLDQFCKSFASHLSSAILEEIPLTSSGSHGRDVQSEPGNSFRRGSELKPKLNCPLCRGDIYGYMVSEPARSYMNSKPRSCSSETCVFQGTYSELRKHARSEHPYVRPSEVDPSRLYDWLRMEQERDMEDLFSSIHASSDSEERDMEDLFSTIYESSASEEREMEDLFSTIHASSGSEHNIDTILFGGRLGDLMSLFFEIFSSNEDDDRMASLLSSSRPRVSLHDRRVSNNAQANLSARWRSNLPSPHQLERIHRGRWTSSLSLSSSSSRNLEANRTARWRTNLTSSSRNLEANRTARWRTNLTSSSRNLEANRTARWRTNLTSSSRNLEANRTARWRTNLTSSSRMPRDDYREMSPGPRTSSTRMPRASHVAQSNPRSNASSSGRNRGGRRQLRWRDQRWSTYHNQP